MHKIREKIEIILSRSGRDVKVFCVSLLLAYGIWLIHNLSLNYSETVSIPVKGISSIEGHTSEASGSALVVGRCRASGYNIIRMKNVSERKPVQVHFDSEDLHLYHDDIYYITSDNLNRYVNQIFGNGTKMEGFVTDTLLLRFPEENHKKVPVCPVYNIRYVPQYTNISPMRIEPDSVVIYGEPYHIDGIDKVFTAPLTLEGVDASVHGEIGLDKIKGIRLSCQSVRYSISVSRYVEETVVLPVEVRNEPVGKSLAVYPSTATVLLRCIFPLTHDPSKDMRLYVDYKDFLKSLKGECLPMVENLPPDVLEYEVIPKVFDCVENEGQ